MNTHTRNEIFDPQILADDLCEVRRMYARFFAALDESGWDSLVKGGSKEWTLHETVAHLCALNRDGVDSIKHTLRGEPHIFGDLADRYQFNAWGREGIDRYLSLPMKALNAELLSILDEAASIARGLQPGQGELTALVAF